MTIKTAPKVSQLNTIVTTDFASMPRRGAKRNLFNTQVDRQELQSQLQQLESENLLTLESYKRDSIIDVIDLSSDDQIRKLKRLPIRSRYDDSGDISGDDLEPLPRPHTLPLSQEPRSNPAINSNEDTLKRIPATNTVTSKKLPDQKIICSGTKPKLPKGQKTIKGRLFIRLAKYVHSEIIQFFLLPFRLLSS